MSIDSVVEEEIVVRCGGLIFMHSPDADPKNVKIAKRFFTMRPGASRHLIARAIADYKGDFRKDSTTIRKKVRVFPRTTGLGLSAYMDLKEIFRQDYNVDVGIPEGLKTHLASGTKISGHPGSGSSKRYQPKVTY